MAGHPQRAKRNPKHAGMAKMLVKRQRPGRGENDEEDPFRDALSSFFSDPMETAAVGPNEPAARPTGVGPAAAPAETDSLMQSSQCRQECLAEYFPASCQDDACICQSRLALRHSAICVAAVCSAQDQRGFLAEIGTVCGAAQSASLVRAAETVVLTTMSSALSSQTSLSSTTIESSTTSTSSSTSTPSAASTSTTASIISIASRSRLFTSTTSSSPSSAAVEVPSTIIETIIPTPSPNALASDSSNAPKDDGTSSISTGAVAGIGVGILLALLLVGLCVWHTRRTLAGRTGAAKEYLRKSQLEGMSGAAAAIGLSEKEKKEEEKSGQRLSRKIPLNGDFWQNVKRQSQLYDLPVPENPFGVRRHGEISGQPFVEQERPAQQYMLPSQYHAQTQSGSIGGPARSTSISFAQQEAPLPLPGSGSTSLALPPTPPTKDRSSSLSNSQYATLPSSPLKPLILPSIQSQHYSPSNSVSSSSSSPVHRKSVSRSGMGVLPSSPPPTGMEEQAEDIKRARSASILSHAKRIPLPASRGNSLYEISEGSASHQQGRAGAAVETIQEKDEDDAVKQKMGVQPKVSFDKLPYLR